MLFYVISRLRYDNLFYTNIRYDTIPYVQQNVSVVKLFRRTVLSIVYSPYCLLTFETGLVCRWSSGTTAHDATTSNVSRSWKPEQDVSVWYDDASRWKCWNAAIIRHVYRTAVRRSAAVRLDMSVWLPQIDMY